MLADAMHFEKDAVFQTPGLPSRCRLERLAMRAEPGGYDALSTNALIHTACNCFNFGKFGHKNSVGDTPADKTYFVSWAR